MSYDLFLVLFTSVIEWGSLIEGVFLGLDFFSHAIMSGLAVIIGYRLLKNKPFLFRAIILFSFLNVVGIYYELYQGVVRDWFFDIIANNVGIVLGLIYAYRKFNSDFEQKYFKKDTDYLRSSLRRRLSQRKKSQKNF